jgi:gamma-glutamyltranspeptidase
MINTPMARRGMVTAPHHLASQSGLAVLREGGNAVEAMVAMAASIAVVYPHMNSIGGDGFWLIHVPGSAPVAIDACGASGQNVDRALYANAGHSTIPTRGPMAANTVAGTVSGWGKALAIAHELGGDLPLGRLLEDAVHYAHQGIPVTAGQERLTTAKAGEMGNSPGFKELFMPSGSPPVAGTTMKNPRLAETLRRIASEGTEGFYRGALATTIANDLAIAGSPVVSEDLANHQAQIVEPLTVRVRNGQLYNMTPPTQGLASLMILAIYDRLGIKDAESFAHVHGIVEATKQAFLVRDSEVTDPRYMTTRPEHFLRADDLDSRAEVINPRRALAWPHMAKHGDTIWMGAADKNGVAVSFIQSIYWEFGSGIVLEESGLNWQNRGASFALLDGAVNELMPGRKPFHTLNPALASMDDGRVISYGTMGGEGQPQTQAAVFSRYAMHEQGLQAAVSAPRWLLGRTWGEDSTNLKIESRMAEATVGALRDAGHDVEIVEPYADMMGHAGAIAVHSDGLIEGATDPRSDGSVASF